MALSASRSHSEPFATTAMTTGINSRTSGRSTTARQNQERKGGGIERQKHGRQTLYSPCLWPCSGNHAAKLQTWRSAQRSHPNSLRPRSSSSTQPTLATRWRGDKKKRTILTLFQNFIYYFRGSKTVTNPHAPVCPICGSLVCYYRSKTKDFICRRCGHVGKRSQFIKRRRT